MVICHKHQYLFVELPQTGSTAISHELCLNYGGEEILHKHATYEEFLRIASEQEKKYFVFSSIRNPLDNAVSYYFKFRNDHGGSFSKLRHSGFFARMVYLDRIKRFEYTQQKGVEFADYFARFYRIPYDDWSSLSHHKFDYVLRFENLSNDFAHVLSLIGIEQVRPLPVVHRTLDRSHDFLSYYTPQIREQAKYVFGSYMKKWGYHFPSEWGELRITTTAKVKLTVYNIPRKLFWKHLRAYTYQRIFSSFGNRQVLERIRQAQK